MKAKEENILSLANFEGPIDFLLHLVQKNEIDVSEIAMHQITAQYLEKLEHLLAPDIDCSAEFIGAAASLLLLKSRLLLPKHEQNQDAEEEAVDPKFEIIHHLIDYCRFKEVAKILKDREEQQGIFFPRGLNEVPEIKKGLGVEHLSLSDLASLFQQVLSKAASGQGFIQEEVWRVSDKMQLLRKLIAEMANIRFDAFFSPSHSKEELVTSFLAVLELMKQGEICIVKELDTGIILIIKASS